MVHILLICTAGMSTSIMVKRMKESAEKRGIEAEIWAESEAKVATEGPKADVILLGPQIRFLLDQVKTKIPDKPIDVIEMRTYGLLDGAAVLDQALALLENQA